MIAYKRPLTNFYYDADGKPLGRLDLSRPDPPKGARRYLGECAGIERWELTDAFPLVAP